MSSPLLPVEEGSQVVPYDTKVGGTMVATPTTSPQHKPHRPQSTEGDHRLGLLPSAADGTNNQSTPRTRRIQRAEEDDQIEEVSNDHDSLMEDEEFDTALNAMNPTAASFLLDHLLDTLLSSSRRSPNKGGGGNGVGGASAGVSGRYHQGSRSDVTDGDIKPINISQRRQLLLLRAYRQKIMLGRQQQGSGVGGSAQHTAATGTPSSLSAEESASNAAGGGGGELVSYASFPYYSRSYKAGHSYHGHQSHHENDGDGAPQQNSTANYPPMVPYEPPTLCCPTCRRPFVPLHTDQPYFTPDYFRRLPVLVKDAPEPVEELLSGDDALVQSETPRPTSGSAEPEDDEVKPAEEPVNPRIPQALTSKEDQHNLTTGYYQQHFVEIRKIGSGTFGGVYACRHEVCGESLGIFAVKKVPIGTDIEYLRATLREVRLLEEVRRHPNVVEYHHSWVDYARTADFGPVLRCLFILQEYASEGSLDDYFIRQSDGISPGGIFGGQEEDEDAKRDRRHKALRERAKRMADEAAGITSNNAIPPPSQVGIPALHRLSNSAVWYFFLSAVAGTRHLHQKGIIHRDLKPQNLLLCAVDDIEDENGIRRSRPPRVMVSDFGTAAVMSELANTPAKSREDFTRTGATGTMEYMAPELFAAASTPCSPVGPGARPTSKYLNHHTKASDMYALGLILYYLAFGGTLPANHGSATIIDPLTGQPIIKGTPENVELDIKSPHHPKSDAASNIDSEDGRALVRPVEMIGLIQLLLSTDPAQRPSCDDILGSAYIRNLLETFEKTSWEEILSYKQPPVSVPTTAGERSGKVSRTTSTKVPTPQRLQQQVAAASSPPPRGMLRIQSAFLDEMDASVRAGSERPAQPLNDTESFVVPYRPTEVRHRGSMLQPSQSSNQLN